VPITSLKFRPGINKETTSYSNKGGWNDCDLIRFRFGYPEKLGGWEKYANSTFLGTSRSLHTWANLEGNKYLGIGTELKFYIEESQTYRDITPIRRKVVGDEVILSLNTETVAFAVSGVSATLGFTGVTINPQSNDTLAPVVLESGVSGTGEVGTATQNESTPAMTASLGSVTVLVPTSITVTDFVDET
jgi:hypothetical protein